MLAEALACVPAVLLLLAAGIGLQLLAPTPLERSAVARLGCAFLLGAAWCTLAVWAAGLVAGAPVSRAGFLLAGAVPLVAGGLAAAARRGAGGLAPRPSRPSAASLPLAIVVVAATFALLANAVSEPVSDFDGRMTWGTAAKYLLASGSVLPEVLRDPDAYVIHPRYPIVMPLVQAAIASLGSVPIESSAIRPVYVLFLPALAASVWPAVRRAGGRRGGALAATLVFATPMLLWNKEGGANGTYSDLPLAAFLGAGLALLVHPRATGQPWRGGFAGLLLAAAVGTKNEGFGLAVAVVLAAVAVAWRGRRLGAVRRAKAPLVATAVVAGALALVLGWRSEVPNRNDEAYFESISASAIVAGLRERAALVGSEIPGRTLDPANFGGLFWLAPLLLVVGRRRLRSPAALLSATAIVVELVQILAAYAVVKDLWIIGVTWTRFLVQLTVPLALLLAAASRGALAAAGWSTARSQSNR